MKRKSKVPVGMVSTMFTTCLIGAMILGTISPVRALESKGEEIGEDVSARFTQELSEDKSQAEVTIQAASGRKRVRIIGITLPDGTYVPGSKAVYEAARNGSYEFIVDYEEIVGEVSNKEPVVLSTPGNAESAGSEIMKGTSSVALAPREE